jgi:hypothetical protein
MSTPTEVSAAPVNTAKVANRRILHFDSLDQMLAEADRLVEPEKRGASSSWATGH